MERLEIEYDFLPRESEILRLHCWEAAFQKLKEHGVLYYETQGKNAGCWVMKRTGKSADGFDPKEIRVDTYVAPGESQAHSGVRITHVPTGIVVDCKEEKSQSANREKALRLLRTHLSEMEGAQPDEDTKVIVRSNGTVGYVGKDIAYHLWKFSLLGMDFDFVPFYRYCDGHTAWRTAVTGVGGQGSGSTTESESTSGVRSPEFAVERGSLAQSAIGDRQSTIPSFGHASAAYAVIDTRQSYLQDLIVTAFHALGFHQQATNLHHFDYEVVGLSPRCAEELGLQLGEADRQRSYVEVSGRKGQGIKGDDLIDVLVNNALQEVQARQITHDATEQATCARMIAVGALRYFLLKFSRRVIIAFDFKDALAFEGETGPYLQYSVVRARNIFRKYSDMQPGFDPDKLGESVPPERLKASFEGDGGRDFWELALLAAQLEMAVDQAVTGEEPAVLAKYAFRLAQAFNNFYHHHRILGEPDPGRQGFLLYLVNLVSQTLARALDLLGIEVPERM
jgi:arginyl-tRNA synthetase